jgi:flagellar motor switch protein FliM
MLSQLAEAKNRSIHNFDFRMAGRLSNEDARTLTAIHEKFASDLSSALDAYLGTGFEVKLQTLDRLPLKQHIVSVSPASYILPLSLDSIPCNIIMECDIDLVLPIIELLMGGEGKARGGERELSDIDEEIMQDVFLLIARQVELAWNLPEYSLVANRRINPAIMQNSFLPNDKVTVVKVDVKIAETFGTLQLVLPSAFTASLMKKIKLDQPRKKDAVRFFPKPPIRERILDCDMKIAAELPGLKVSVRDLIALQPGSVLKFRAPIHSPGMITAGGRGLFEAMLVRNGLQKAAQLGCRAPRTNSKRG